ncbi:hypothetical protein SSS_07981 [Sarcoptes scabiei]|uniref:DUF1057 domain containing protein n=1 Tax=Sarcoptes scabiei TaxID=52283 RepID=A0A834RCR7_SARSC|nr:hypothetical protein SSS_07981 [Sarcoptes scabiei]
MTINQNLSSDSLRKAEIYAEYPIKYVHINTCSHLYRNWALNRKSMYAKHPNGLDLLVEYADNIDNLTGSNHPIIVALHGAPGSHEDFAPFIQYFTSKNIRMIVPNYPDFKLTIQTKVFRHSSEEKFQFVKDFLLAINVKRIDLLLSHSSSVYPTTLMLFDQNQISIKAVGLFNPAGHRRIMAMRPAWFTEGSVKVYQNKLGRFIYKVFGRSFIKVTNTVM